MSRPKLAQIAFDNFFEEFSEDGEAKYRLMMQAVANRTLTVFKVYLDDVAKVYQCVKDLAIIRILQHSPCHL